MIKINKFVQPVIPIFDPNDVKIGEVTNNSEFVDVRTQIVVKKLTGYYYIYDNIRYDFSIDGKVNWIDGLYDSEMDCLSALFKAQMCK